MLFVGALLLMLLMGCSNPFREAAQKDTTDAWRAFLASGRGGVTEREHALERHEQLVWQEARDLDKVAGYRRYLELYPDGRMREDAVGRLEALRFERAMEAGTAVALEEFLFAHPDGENEQAARERLVRLLRQAALEEGTIVAYESFARRFPEDGGAGCEVREALEHARYHEAEKEGSLDALLRYQRRFPDGAYFDEADLRSKELRIKARVLAGDVKAARRIVDESAAGKARERLAGALQRALVEAAKEMLDIELLEQLAEEEACEEASGLAREMVAKLEELSNLAELEDAAVRLSSSEPGLPRSVIGAWLADRDARRRRVAVRALGYSGDPNAIATLARALTDRNLGVSAEAVEAIRRLGDSLHPMVRDVFITEALVRLEARAAGSELAWVAGVLLEAAGHEERAVDAYRRATESRKLVLPRMRLAHLEKDEHRRTVALTGAALWLRDEVRARMDSLEPSAPGSYELEKEPDRSLLRHFPAFLAKLAEMTELAEAQPGSEERFTWISDVRDLLARSHRAYAAAEARAAAADSSWLVYGVDEAAASRKKAGRERAKAVRVVAEAAPRTEIAVNLLQKSARSAHEEESRAATEWLVRKDPQ